MPMRYPKATFTQPLVMCKKIALSDQSPSECVFDLEFDLLKFTMQINK